MRRETLAVGVVALAALAGSANAQVLKFAGFEASEGYVLGDLFGQNGWTDTGDVANVTSALAATGTRSVSIDSSPVASSSWWWPSVNYNTATATNKTVVASIDMYLKTGGTKSANWGLDCYDGAGSFGRVTAMWVNSGGLVNYWDGTTSVVSSTSVAYDAWNNLKITMDYVTKKASFALNGTTIASGVNFSAGVSNIFGDSDMNLQGAGFDTTFFDNYKVEAVPAPSALALIGLGGLVAGRRRRA